MKAETFAKQSMAVFEAIFGSEVDELGRRAIIYSCIMTEALREDKSPKELIEAIMGFEDAKNAERKTEIRSEIIKDYKSKCDDSDDEEEKAEGEIVTEILKLLSGRSMLDIMAIIGIVVKTVVANTPISTDEFLNMLIGMPED